MKHSPGTTRDIDEWAAATTVARERRSVVGQQLQELVVSYDVQGSGGQAAEHVRAVAAASRGSDLVLLRSRVMDAAAAFGAWAADLDARIGESGDAVAA